MTAALVRYGRLRTLVELAAPAADEPLPTGPWLLETPRGLELGQVLGRVASPPRPEAGRLVRPADPAELEQARALAEQVERVDLPAARAALPAGKGLVLVAGERLLEGPRLVLYYSAASPVDVPALLRGLHEALDVEVALEQVGARARAKACGGAGVCGRTLCCSTFLRRLEPVSMRAAQAQGLTRTPEATAGLCGRLKCCLRYEQGRYEEDRKGLPREGWWVRSRRVEGTAIAVDLLRRRVRVRPLEGPSVVLFAEEIEKMGPALRAPLEQAGAAPPNHEPPEGEERGGWSGLARRLWRRVTPRPAEEAEDEDDQDDLAED